MKQVADRAVVYVLDRAEGVAVTSAAQFLARILDGAPQPVWVVDEEGLIVFSNPAAVEALGYDDSSELYRRPSHDTVHYQRADGSPYPQDECPMLTPSRTGETVHGEDEWFTRRDGSMFPIAWWSAPIAVAGGTGAVLAFSDISERRAAEQAVRERDAAEIRAAESRAWSATRWRTARPSRADQAGPGRRVGPLRGRGRSWTGR